MHTTLAVIAGLIGVTIIALTTASALQTFVVPRGTPLLLTRWVLLAVRAVFILSMRHLRDYSTRDRVMAMFAPTGLMTLPVAWMTLLLIGFVPLYWAFGSGSWKDSLLASGSGLLTLGFHAPDNLWTGVLSIIEAGFGLGLLALLISYLPSIYNCYSRREQRVTALEVEAGSPPFAPNLLVLLLQIKGLPLLHTYWSAWRHWFNDIEETHSTTPILVYFRSPAPERSWVTAAGAVLDSAALAVSVLDVDKPQPDAELCIRSGYLALRRIGDYFLMPYDPDPTPDLPIAITREEFDEACQRLADAGATLKADRDQAWHDFAGWRVTYEGPLLRFASLCMAPPAPWSSDRPIHFNRLPVTRRHARARLHTHRGKRLVPDRPLPAVHDVPRSRPHPGSSAGRRSRFSSLLRGRSTRSTR
ncbi:MAG: hypothetical protein JWR24_3068 [Actinoallomurus sp.]|nr:hypothetical protein [Actinoallomurus sp.]